jgi:hypothetical protein
MHARHREERGAVGLTCTELRDGPLNDNTAKEDRAQHDGDKEQNLSASNIATRDSDFGKKCRETAHEKDSGQAETKYLTQMLVHIRIGDGESRCGQDAEKQTVGDKE